MSKYIVFDFETTGFSGIKDEIIEIGMIKVENDHIIDTLSCLVKANVLLPQKIIEITHITDGMLSKQGISKLDAAQKIYHFLDDDAILMGYNVMFDISFLIPFLKTYVDGTFLLKNPIIDVLTIFRDLYPGTHKLGDAVSYFKIDHINTHRALDDVMSTWEVYKEISNQHPNIETIYKNIIGYNPMYGYRQLKLDHIKAWPHQAGKKEIMLSRKFT
jgi:DNA polymerase III alpha subunit (gram-positive type)